MIVAVRVNGIPDVSQRFVKVMNDLRMPKKHNCMIYKDDKNTINTLKNIKDFVTYGEINKEDLTSLLKKRSNLENYLGEMKYSNIEEIAEELIKNKLDIKELESKGLKLPFRLSPPSKGFSGTNKQYKQGGSLGYRGEEINNLLKRMI